MDTINSHVILKMLLDLNSKEKVTMIMVTHDVAMRNHANRVIHMLDGKIQRVEDIAPLSRQEAYEKLQRQVKVESVFKGLSMPSENDSSKTEYRDLGNAHSWLIPA